MGEVGRRDISYAADDEETVKSSWEEDDFAAWLAYRKAHAKVEKEKEGSQRGEQSVAFKVGKG